MIVLDQMQNFIFDNHPIRGTIVRLENVFQTVKERHPYPQALQTLLGEAMVGVALLSGMTKRLGNFTLQFQGEGALKLLSVRITADFQLRGIAKWEGEIESGASLSGVLGKGILTLTYEPLHVGERYQSIIDVKGASIAEALELYFAQSEQCATRLIFRSNQQAAVGFLLQTLPDDKTVQEESFSHVVHLADTITAGELLQLDNATLLHRLYHQEIVRIFTPIALHFGCTCSIPRMENALLIMGKSEVLKILEEHATVEVCCEFCHRKYEFDPIDIEQLFRRNPTYEPPSTLH